MGRWICIIVIVLAGGFGAFLASGYGTDGRAEVRPRSHLRIIREQLGVLKQHLLAYGEVHGRYPNNDEGLAALDDFEARFTVELHGLRAGPLDRSADLYLRYEASWWWTAKDSLPKFRAEHGRAPIRSEELASVFLGRVLGLQRRPEPDGEPIAPDWGPISVQVAIDRADNAFLLCRGLPLTPSMVPYVYENRRGREARLFGDSPADADGDRRWSVRVDDGVYVYAPEGQAAAEELDRLWWQRNWPRFIGASLLVLALALTVGPGVRRWRKGALAVLAGSALAGGAAHLMGRATCYVPVFLFFSRDAKMVARQRALLDTYHRRGVIGDEAYDRAVAALKLEPATRPATAPSDEP